MYDLHVSIIMISDIYTVHEYIVIYYAINIFKGGGAIHSITLNILFHYAYRHNNNTIRLYLTISSHLDRRLVSLSHVERLVHYFYS